MSKEHRCEYCLIPAVWYDTYCGLYYCDDCCPETTIYNDCYIDLIEEKDNDRE